MTLARIFWAPLAATAVLAACSGNLGGGQSTLPGTPQTGTNVQQVAPPPATATPSSASNVATVGDTVAPQALPNIQGWGGSIAFVKPAPANSPNPKSTATANAAATAAAVSIGVTAGVVEPSDAPKFDSSSAKRHAKHDPTALTPLLFVSLLATSDVTLAAYPKIAFDMPRDIAAKHRDDSFALALYDPEQKDKAFRLAVAERDLSSPDPGSAPSPALTVAPSPIPTPIPNGPLSLTPPPLGMQPQGSSLPPEHVAFAATATALTLKANRPVVFALYAVPPQPSPSPSGSPLRNGAASPSPSPSSGSSSAPAAQTSPAAPPVNASSGSTLANPPPTTAPLPAAPTGSP